jgi:hypothetical protein
MVADPEYVDKLRSLNVARPGRRAPKVTIDVHDRHTVTVTEHWHDRQDVLVKPQPVRMKARGTVHG